MIAQIVPLKKIPRRLKYFDYHIPSSLQDKIKVGQIAKIPWRNQVIFGLIKNINSTPSKKGLNLKTIIGLVNQEPLTTAKQRKFISALSIKYWQSESLFWRMILPKIPAKKTNYRPWLTAEKFSVNSELFSTNTNLKIKPNNLITLIIPDHQKQLYNLVVNLLALKDNTLVVCPELYHLQKILKLLPKSKLENIAVIHKNLSASEYWHEYKKIISGKAKLILGTRLAVFLPLDKIKQLIIFKSDDYSLKQSDQNPRFLVHDTLPELIKYYNLRLIFLSLAPRLETYAWSRQKNNNLIKLQRPRPIKLVDLNQEMAGKNYTFLSFFLQKQISTELKNKKKIFLFLNKKGRATYFKCSDCQRLLTCPKCQTTLVPLSENVGYCRSCRLQINIPSACTHCHGLRLRLGGITNQILKRNLAKIFPKATSSLFDAEHPQLDKKADIIIGTEYAYQKINPENYSLLGIITDSISAGSEYNATEKQFQLVNNLIRLDKGMSVIIQTFNPESEWLSDLLAANYHKFWNREMNWRKKFNYPPYNKFLKIIYYDQNKKIAAERINNFYNSIANLTNHPLLTIYEPMTSSTTINNKFLYYVLIKFNPKTKLLSQIINKVPDNFILDFNPYNVL